ncbi:MAG: hypothetical protein CFE43_04795 [Burkholderiales bacterium PBB3]|nr:MAG: hypothetical protein CFE43_04795 [Burkholderiales bacterium PBB3]
MATKPPTSGLLSKVASIFRAPDGRDGTGAAKGAAGGQHDADESRHNRVGDNEKNALQALIQRKRQDDLVRRREFNYLRKLRKSPLSAGIVGHELAGRPSAFQTSSSFAVDDRASTLRKIDAIEAHMISSWARSKVASVAPPADQRGGRPLASGAGIFESDGTIPAPLRTEPPKTGARAAAPTLPGAGEELDSMDLDFTGLLSAQGGQEVDTFSSTSDSDHNDTVAMPLGGAEAPRRREDLAPLEFTLSDMAPSRIAKMPPVRVAVAPAPPAAPVPLPEHVEAALQDAAIQFAEGDNANAEAMLLSLLQDTSLTTASADVVASALFDLYRATGQQDGFDVVAMDYAERFGRSPAEWFSLPELLQAHAEATPVASPSAVALAAPGKVWESPALLSAAAVAALRLHFPGSKSVWHVDWFALSEIEPGAAPALADLLSHWCTQPVELHWSGVESLLRAQQRQTPADDKTVDPLWWKMRLDTLCILQRHDDFESLALDYCVVYEVSPPSWQNPACTFVQDHSPSEFGALEDGPPSVFVDDLPAVAGPFAVSELFGSLVGEPVDALAKLSAAADTTDHIVVSCALLVRMDFSAAGALLNWAIDRETNGCQIQLVKVPRLIAVFFQMLGIDRHAKILVRAN